ncbi:MAG: NAD(P)/FAD-dependent oxidoreductase [Deltaproteobacteria bacterium]|nr:NAD(P)/FAD-dependent oxidoreductase [Deltaproteobacteria bacterium]
MGQTIVVLGGGVGGLIAANSMRLQLGQEHRIVLIEKNRDHTFAPSFPWVMTGYRTSGQITRDIRSLVRQGIEIVIDEATDIDCAKRVVTTKQRQFNYDYLVIALGADLRSELIPGLTDNAHTFYTLDGARKLHEALKNFKGGDIALVVSSMPYKCPGAPHEAAMLISSFLQRRSQSQKVNIHLFTPESQPMPVAGPQLGGVLKQMTESRGIKFYPFHKLTSVDAENKELRFEGKTPVHYDMLIAIPPHRAPAVVVNAGITNEAGWIPVDSATLKANYEGVFAVGDITSLSIPGRWNPAVPMALPKAGVFAHAEGEIVAGQIVAAINHGKPAAQFSGIGYCIIEAGQGVAGLAYGNFMAEPHPQVLLRKAGRRWHIGRVLFEKWWLAPLTTRGSIFRHVLNAGTKIYKVPVKL